MTDRDELVEKVAKAIAGAEIAYYGPRSSLEQCMNWANEPDCYRQAASAAIDIVLEEAAHVVLNCDYMGPNTNYMKTKIAAALRTEVDDLGNRLHHVHRLWANNEHALRAENERLRTALELFACDCIESGNLCPSPQSCRNYIARAALEEKI